MTASLSIRQVIEAGPKMPSTDPAARARTVSRAVSRSLSETKCAPFETNGDRFSPHVCAFYRNSASKSPPNVVALRDFVALGTRRLGVVERKRPFAAVNIRDGLRPPFFWDETVRFNNQANAPL